MRRKTSPNNALDAEPPIASFLKSVLIGGGPVNANVRPSRMINPYHPNVSDDSNAVREERPARDSLWMYVFACIATLTTAVTLILVSVVSLQRNVDKLVYVVFAILACLPAICAIGIFFRMPSIAIATMVPLLVAWILTTTGGGAHSTLSGFLFTLPFLVPYIGHKMRERSR